jgi:hypothetical protein
MTNPLDLEAIEARARQPKNIEGLIQVFGTDIPALIARIRELEAPASPAPEAVKLVEDFEKACDQYASCRYTLSADAGPRITAKLLRGQARQALLSTPTRDPQGAESGRDWNVIEALNGVSLIDIMLEASREARPSITVSAYMLDTFAKAIRAHFAKKALSAPAPSSPRADGVREAESLVRLMIDYLETDRIMGIPLVETNADWLEAAQKWTESMHDPAATQSKAEHPIHEAEK